MKKKCSKCNADKVFSEFPVNKIRKDGLHSWCRICTSAYLKKYNKENYYTPRATSRRRKYNSENRDEISAKRKKYNRENKEKIAAMRRVYYKLNSHQWVERREKNRMKFNAYPVSRRKTDIMFAVAGRLRDRTRTAFRVRGWRKSGPTEKLLGTSFELARRHLESQFLPGMSWENRGKWHIDHVVPLASAKTPKEMAILCKYTNLQPLWAVDNFRKNAKMPTHVVSSLRKYDKAGV